MRRADGLRNRVAQRYRWRDHAVTPIDYLDCGCWASEAWTPGLGAIRSRGGPAAGRIQALVKFREESEKASRRGVFVGLLGSVEKRLPEVSFARSQLGADAQWRRLVSEALQRSRD